MNLPVNSNIQGFSNITGSIIQGEQIIAEPIHYLTLQNILIIIYLFVSLVLLLRFIINIYKIIRQIRTGSIVDNFNTQIVLVENKTLPHSFFRYIFVNCSDYENGKIENELIIHEQTHCLQYHSIDIIIIELVKIVLWFNPLLWFFRKAIQLNHEFLADNKVLSTHGLNDYQNTLLNLVFRNNSSYLASNFNYSLTKKRLIMMTKNNSLNKAISRKIAAISLFLILSVTLTFSQEFKQNDSMMNYQNEWWYPILKKHNLEPSGFNNFDKIFEMGTKNSINNKIVTLENAFFLIKPLGDEYVIIKSPLAYHNLDKNTIEGDEGTMETFKINSGDAKPFAKHQFKKFIYQLNGDKSNWKAQNIEGWVDTKK